MKVQLAAKAGFCFGVKRALDMAEQTVDTMPAVSLGPLIHNQQVVKCLAERGIHVVNTLEEVLAGQALIIRSHGVGPSVYQEAEKKGIQVADATCPFVQKAQRLAAGSAQLGQQVIVFGDKLHQEVQGILGWAGKEAIPIQTLEEAKQLPFYPQLAILAQTTQLTESFEEIVQELKLHTNELIVHNTICNATSERQKAARELAQIVDIMVVVGGRNSANTQKLANICAEFTKTYMIETAEELEIVWFKGAASAGLTAGASTPDWIIKEVYQKMSEINVNEMDKTDWLESMKDIHVGSRVTGKVVKIEDDELYVDIGWKSEGIVPFVDDKGIRQIHSQDQFSVGDEITAVVIRIENEEGHTVLSKRQADEAAAQERLAKLAESKEEFPVKVVEVVKGGLLVDIGLRGFIPASQIQLGYVEDLNKFLGETLRVKIIEFDPGKRKVVLSQRIILEEEKAAKRQQLMETLQVGDIVNGVVLRIVNFGAFIDIGGIDGLLHISEMSYARIKHPSEVLKIGDEVQVQVLKFDNTTGRLSLGLKQLQENPWDRVAEKYPIGSIVQGVVVRIVPFGAFVELEEGVDGLVHISQLADYHVNKVEDILTVGDVIRTKVIECKPEAKRISLSLREADREIGQTSDVEAADSQSESQVELESESQVESQVESQSESQSESQAENESVTISDVLDQDHAQE